MTPKTNLPIVLYSQVYIYGLKDTTQKFYSFSLINFLIPCFSRLKENEVNHPSSVFTFFNFPFYFHLWCHLSFIWFFRKILCDFDRFLYLQEICKKKQNILFCFQILSNLHLGQISLKF